MPEWFLGTQTLRLDDKGRLFLPAKYRDDLAGGVVITKGQGQERCLYVFTKGEFARIAEAQRTEAEPTQAVRDRRRIFFAGASEALPDRQGRISIPTALRTYAGLQHDCSVVGAGTRLEIWDSRAWEAYEAAQEAAAAEEVLPGVS